MRPTVESPEESARIAALQALGILDTPADPLYDDIVLLASQLCASPIALVSLIDEDRQWFKARTGLEATETPRDIAFCAHAIQRPGDLLVVEDAAADPRFRNNPLVTGAPHIRFYAGAPIVTAGGEALGTVCVIDDHPRRLESPQAAALAALARQVGALLELGRTAALQKEQSRALQKLGEQARLQQEHSDELLDVVLRGADLGLWELRLQNDHWTSDPRERELLGYRPDEDPAGPAGWRALVHPEDLPAVEQALARHASGETAHFSSEHRMRHRDGQWRWMRSSGVIVEHDAQGVPLRLVGTDLDITARRLERDALLHANSMLQRTSGLAQVGGWQLDLASSRLSWSEQVYRIHEIDPGTDLSLLSALDFYSPESRPAIEEAVEAAIHGGTPYDLELPFVTARGRHIWVRAQGVAVQDENGMPVRLEGAFQDITLRKTAQQAVERSEERLQLALSGTRSAVFDWNLGTGRVHRGAQFSAMRGGPAVETVWEGAELEAVIHPDDLGDVLASVMAALKGEQPLCEMEYRVSMIDNRRWIWVRTVIRVSERSPGGRALRCTGTDEDITQRKDSQLRLEESQARLKAITDNLPVLIAEFDAEQRFVFCNATFERWLGVAPQDLLGRSPASLPGSVVDPGSRARHLKRALSGHRVSFEQTLQEPTYRILQSTYLPRRDARGTVLGVYAISSDITQEKAVQQQLLELTRIDPLTGISNRRHFDELLADAMARSRRSGAMLALFYLDIDRFKSINDRHGHAVGDAVLCEYTRRVRSCIRETDKLARHAGDEFVLLLEPCAGPERARSVGEKILAAVRAPLTQVPGFDGPITTSIGAALYDGEKGVTMPALLKRSDVALYRAKAEGRNRLCIEEAGPVTS